MKIVNLFLSIICFNAVCLNAYATANSITKEEVFKNVYQSSQIDSRKCGQNSILLIKEWKKHGLDISKSEIWSVTNKGFNYFGLVKYYQNRWSSLEIRSTSANGEVYRTNGTGGWYFHAFVVDEGKVYDASFYDSPRVLPLNEYINEMFILKHDIGTNYWEKRQRSLEMVKKYAVDSVDGESAIREDVPYEKVSCGYLHDLMDKSIERCL